MNIWTNGTDTVIAKNIDDAWHVWCEHMGERREDYEGEIEWTRIPDDKKVSLVVDSAEDMPGGFARLDACGRWHTAREAGAWIEICGRGFF